MSFVMHVMSIELTVLLLFYFWSQVFNYYLPASYHMEFLKKWMLTTNKHLLKLALSDFSVMVKLCFKY